MGMVWVAFLAARICPVPSCYYDDVDLKTHELGRKLTEPIALPLRISVLDGDVLSLYVANLAQTCLKYLGTGRLSSWIVIRQIPYPWNLFRLLRVHRRAKREQQGA
jgi:hypothetical protein